MSKKNTSWGKVADWYNQLLEERQDTYQKDLIFPNLLRLLDIQKNEVILDLACGTGFFSQEFARAGASVIGTDISKELIKIAKNQLRPENQRKIIYFVAPADKVKFLKDESADKIVIILAIQNLENVAGVFAECQRILKKGGKIFLVMNHPAFRIPKVSSWEWDAKNKNQYRRIDQYLSESKAKIQMHPSTSSGQALKPSEYTLSFHRPLQFYFKALQKAGFCVSRLEEWNSHKKSGPGPRSAAENQVRKEIPLFLFLEAVKNG